MCVIFFYANSNPSPDGYKLILASNRDEFFARDTRSAAKWANAEHVYGGIDLEPGREGGTWLAIGGHEGVFKVGALLNLTGEPKPRNAIVHETIVHNNNCHNNKQHAAHSVTSSAVFPPSSPIPIHNDHFLLGRGMIVSDFVTSGDAYSIESYNRDLVSDCTKYSAFNFVSIEIGARTTPARITLCSNVPPILEQFNEAKCYGFGNSLPAVPFEKVRNGTKRFEAIVDDFHTKHQHIDTAAIAQAELIKNLTNLLKCKQKFWPDAELKRRAPNWGEHLSAINVNIPHEGYGSRTHTIILVDSNDKMHFLEETMLAEDIEGEWSQTHIEKQYFKD